MTIEQLAAQITNSLASEIESIDEADLDDVERILTRHLKDFAAEIGEAYRRQMIGRRIADD